MSEIEKLIRSIVRDELARTQPANEQSEQLTVAAYARHWSIAESTVRHAISEGRLAVTRIGRSVRIASDARITPGGKNGPASRARMRLLGGGTVR